jgi:uncharacterized repeat protein (TIGR02543 family)
MYTVTFDLNGGKGAVPIAQIVSPGDSVKLPNNFTFYYTGYIFGGWNTSAKGSGTNYKAGDTFTPTESITLYAQWLSTYTVTFNLNGGTGATPGAQTVSAGSSVALPYNSGFSYTGYAFMGWNTRADASGANYNAGAYFTPSASVTLYAKWEPSTGSGTINISLSGPSEKMITISRSITDNLSKSGGGSITLGISEDFNRCEWFIGANTAAEGKNVTLQANNAAFAVGINWITVVVYDGAGSMAIPYSGEFMVLVAD